MKKLKLNLKNYRKYEKENMIKYIPGSAGYYITRNGIVLKLDDPITRTMSVKSPTVRKDGYLIIHLIMEETKYYESLGRTITTKSSKHFYISKLVAEAFIGPKPEGWYIKYKDGIKTHCNVDNLEYVKSKKDLYYVDDEILQAGNELIDNEGIGIILPEN